VIHRNAILALRSDLDSGHIVAIQLVDGSSVQIDSIVGVQDESHAIVMGHGVRLLLPLDQIVAVAVSNTDGDSTEPLYD
jgi:hypothetical protein